MRRFPVESCSPAWRARSARSLSTGRGWLRCPDKPPPSRRTPPRFRGRPSASCRGISPNLSPQLIDGLTSTSEWSGVPLALLFREVGVKPGAKWFLAEGEDAAVMSRSIPMEKAWDDALLAYGQNGEALRPE